MTARNSSRVGPRYPAGRRARSAPPAIWPGASCCRACSTSCSAGFIPGCRIIGVSLDDLDADGFRAIAREGARPVLHAQGRARPTGPPSRQTLDYVPLAAGAGALKAAVERAEQSLGGESRRLHYLSVPPSAALPAVRHAGRGRPRRAAPASSWRSRSAPTWRAPWSLNAKLHEVFDEEQIFRIDHFLGKEAAQNILAFRFANGLFEPIWNRNFIDHVQIDVPETLGLGKRAGFYEADRRLPRHGGHAPVPDPRLHGDGAADRARAGADQRGEEQGLPQHAADRAEGRGARAVRRLPRPRRASTRESDTETFIALKCAHRQLALGRRAVLPAHRQAAGRGAAHHLDRLPRAAQEHVPGRLGRRRAGAGPPDLRPRRRLEDVAVVLRQAPRPRHAARQAQPAVRHARHRPGSATCSRPTSG